MTKRVQELTCHCVCHGNTDSRVLCGHCTNFDPQEAERLKLKRDEALCRFVIEKKATATHVAERQYFDAGFKAGYEAAMAERKPKPLEPDEWGPAL